jgi:hypothetical protein
MTAAPQEAMSEAAQQSTTVSDAIGREHSRR